MSVSGTRAMTARPPDLALWLGAIPLRSRGPVISRGPRDQLGRLKSYR